MTSSPGHARSDPVVDVHCHVLSRAADELIKSVYDAEDVREREPYELYAGAASAEHNRQTLFPRILPKLTDPDERLRDMDRMGIDVQVLATFVSQFYYWTDPDLGARLSRLQNDNLAEIANAHPDRFAAIGTVPLQDTGKAVAELEHVVSELGFNGVQISSNVAGADLDDPRFLPFFARAQELGAVVLIHPNGFTEGRRFTDYFLVNVIGNPLDSTMALTRLIFAGVLERLPDLKLCVVHGGGYLPSYWARMDHAFEVRPECRARISEPPSTYLRRVHFDTMVFDPGLLAHLVEFAGAERVLLGTDYPFDMGEDDPLGLIDDAGLPGDDVARIRGGNALGLFGLA
jgi:aminocarboxymuconate-semialdehyde decarboxylase